MVVYHLKPLLTFTAELQNTHVRRLDVYVEGAAIEFSNYDVFNFLISDGKYIYSL